MASALSTVNRIPSSSLRPLNFRDAAAACVHRPSLHFPARCGVVAVRSAAPNGRGVGSGTDQIQRSGKTQQQIAPRRRVLQSSPLGLWDRFPTARTVEQMMDTMERIMDDPFAYRTVGDDLTVVSGSAGGGGGYQRGRTPWEIKETDEDYRMRFDMPGMRKEDVRVWVEESALIVRAEKQLPVTNGSEGSADAEAAAAAAAAAMDWSPESFGRYGSRIVLPETAEAEKIRAEVRDGVLYITVPKRKSNSKVVDINVE